MTFRDSYMDIYDTLDFENFSQEELEDFGRKLVRLFNIHLSFIGYNNIKKYDFFKKDIYNLAEESKDLVVGTPYINRSDYEDRLRGFLETVGNFKVSNPNTSVKRGLQTSVRKEMVDLRTTLNNKQGFAFWENL